MLSIYIMYALFHYNPMMIERHTYKIAGEYVMEVYTRNRKVILLEK